jgi:hypothetical protein
MATRERAHDPRPALIGAALGPFAWKGWSEEMVARRIVAALDRDTALPPHDDERVDVVQDALADCRWRVLSSAGLARRVIAALDAWHQRRQWLDIELAWLLDEAS